MQFRWYIILQIYYNNKSINKTPNKWYSFFCILFLLKAVEISGILHSGLLEIPIYPNIFTGLLKVLVNRNHLYVRKSKLIRFCFTYIFYRSKVLHCREPTTAQVFSSQLIDVDIINSFDIWSTNYVSPYRIMCHTVISTLNFPFFDQLGYCSVHSAILQIFFKNNVLFTEFTCIFLSLFVYLFKFYFFQTK